MREDNVLKKYAQLLNGMIVPAAAESIMNERKLTALNDKRRMALAKNDEAAVSAMAPEFEGVMAEREKISASIERIRKVLEEEMVEEEAKDFRNGVRARAVANQFRVNIEGVVYNYAREIMRIVMPWDHRTLAFIFFRDEEGMDLKEISVRSVEMLLKRVAPKMDALRVKADESVMDLEAIVASGDSSADESFGADEELRRKEKDFAHLEALLESLQKGAKRRAGKRELEEVFEVWDRERRDREKDREFRIKTLKDEIYRLVDRESILLSRVKAAYDEDEKEGFRLQLSRVRGWKADKEEELRKLFGNGHVVHTSAEAPIEPSKSNSALAILNEFEVVEEDIAPLAAVTDPYAKEAVAQEAAAKRHEVEVKRLEEEIKAATTEGRFNALADLVRERDEYTRKAVEARGRAVKAREKIAALEAAAVEKTA